VVAMRASIGMAVPVPDDLPTANLTQGTARVAPREDIDGRWLLHVFRTRAIQEQCSIRAVGTTFKTLNIWDLRRIRVPTPTLGSCRALADEIDHLVAQREQMRALLRRQIALLQERRQSLITAAVTGQLDAGQLDIPEAA
jgi:type I restriction enzyme, S subunit